MRLRLYNLKFTNFKMLKRQIFFHSKFFVHLLNFIYIEIGDLAYSWMNAKNNNYNNNTTNDSYYHYHNYNKSCRLEEKKNHPMCGLNFCCSAIFHHQKAMSRTF